MEADEFDVAINDLEVRLERLRALYDQYFLGFEKIEPTVPRKDVDRRIWALKKVQVRNTAKRFKLNTVVQRYNTLQQHWMRVCREIENGTYKRHLQRAKKRLNVTEADLIALKQGRLSQKLAADDAAAREEEKQSARERAEAATKRLEADMVALDGGVDGDAALEAAITAAMAPRESAPPSPQQPPPPSQRRPPPPSQRRPPPPSQRRPAPQGPLELDLDSPQPAASAPAPATTGIRDIMRSVKTPPPPAPARPPPPRRPPPPSAGAAAAAPRPTASAQRPAPPARRPAPSAQSPSAAAAAAARRDRLSDRRVQELHERLVAAKRSTNDGGKVSVDKLAKSLRATEEKLRKQHAGRSVDFDVVVKNGKAMVKPIVR